MEWPVSTSRARIDARAWIVAGLLLLAGLMALPWGPPLWAAALLVPVTLAVGKPPLGRLTGAFLALSWMLVITVLVHGFSTPGRLLWEVPGIGWTVTVEGLEKGGQFAGRLAAVVVVGAGISLSVGPLEGLRAVESLARPLAKIGLPVGGLTLVFGMALRFVPTLFDEALQVKKALTARGWTAGHGLVGRIRAWIPLFIPVLASGLRRSDDLAETLILRGFDPQARRTSLYPARWGLRETGVVLLVLVPYLLVFV